MTLVFSVPTYYSIQQKNHAKRVITKPLIVKKMYKFPKMGMVTQKSCGCGK